MKHDYFLKILAKYDFEKSIEGNSRKLNLNYLSLMAQIKNVFVEEGFFKIKKIHPRKIEVSITKKGIKAREGALIILQS